jgi:hypothetical protein
MPYLAGPDGDVVLYLAGGPDGRPIGLHLISRVDMEGLPPGAQVSVVTEQTRAGVQVYAVPNHTLN